MAAERIEGFARRGQSEGGEFLQAGARGLAYGLARSYAAGLLLEHADWRLRVEEDRRGVGVAARWCEQPLAPLGCTNAAPW